LINHLTYYQSTFGDKRTLRFIVTILIAAIFTLCGLFALWYTLQDGLIIWGINNRISWGFAIINFIFWIGIAHAGTLISAILYLLNQRWRITYNRTAEIITLIAIPIAGLFPLLHTGRPWFASYWLLPYYNQMGLLPNFKSPLTWDIIAIITYFIISAIFFYIGILPDLSLLKLDIKSNLLKKLYYRLSSFWKGTKLQWDAHRTLYLLIAGIATPLVISVHSIVSFDFYVTFVQSWHTAILPPYFVLGAIFSGLAIINVIIIFYKYLTNSLDKFNKVHSDKINKLILFISIAIAFIYFMEFSTGLVDNEWKTQFIPLINGGIYIYLILTFNVLFPFLFIFKYIRQNYLTTFIISMFILIGMWLERYIIVVNGQELYTSLVENTFYHPSLIDWMLLAGSIGAFLFIFLIISRIFPIQSISEQNNNE